MPHAERVDIRVFMLVYELRSLLEVVSSIKNEIAYASLQHAQLWPHVFTSPFIVRGHRSEVSKIVMFFILHLEKIISYYWC